jgi:hypothetical protein
MSAGTMLGLDCICDKDCWGICCCLCCICGTGANMRFIGASYYDENVDFKF